jgi:CRISPR-associated protein Cas1
VIKRTIEISREPAHLALRNEQLLLKRDGVVVGQAPCEDLGVVVVDHPQTTYTHAALAKLAECGAAVVLCGPDHLPAAMILPLADHSQVVWRLRDQLAIGRPLAKQLWKQLVVAKIRGQARNLHPSLPACRKLLALAGEVRSGDPTNVEAQAARVYWQNWLWSDDPTTLDVEAFRRDADAPGLNAFLNYGYAILRAGLGRAIVAAGLLPSLGLHHRNRSNAFCLADDLIEPFRPLVDDRVRAMHRQGFSELNQPAKAELLGLLTLPMRLGEQTGPLMVMLHRTVASLARCFAGEAKRLEIPVPADSPLPNAVAEDGREIAEDEPAVGDDDRGDERPCKSPGID